MASIPGSWMSWLCFISSSILRNPCSCIRKSKAWCALLLAIILDPAHIMPASVLRLVSSTNGWLPLPLPRSLSLFPNLFSNMACLAFTTYLAHSIKSISGFSALQWITEKSPSVMFDFRRMESTVRKWFGWKSNNSSSCVTLICFIPRSFVRRLMLFSLQ